ncbi:ribonuclease H-like domain-containing protein [Mycotypha africana]|uniref:ribonuclease H-like domain-containing protein n=1 Tax=Mycotypha africana TaxID=64632 RepID=UPI00230042D2|nr:ribonuclease H-like domain-containing protein [Mycotypha africana]KAI8991105.1 ribonuclease H-like domain-containing protein [Mycotypha africana]
MLFIVKRGFSSLSTKKVAELKSIAVQCGVKTTGKKIDLVDRLVSHFGGFTTASTTSQVLSFDLGYRNLAYCVLDKDSNIKDWARVDLDLDSFHPSVVAPVVRQFVTDRVQCHLGQVDRVLIEQQRARSGGGHAVLEATLRVNCVEAVLWTGLYEAVDRLPKKRYIEMTPLLRQSIDNVWMEDLETVIKQNSERFKGVKKGYYLKKQASTMLVQHWLQTNSVFHCDDNFKAMFLKEKKRDDLSDCLMQALAWFKWEKYTKNFIDKYIEDNNNIKTGNCEKQK